MWRFWLINLLESGCLVLNKASIRKDKSIYSYRTYTYGKETKKNPDQILKEREYDYIASSKELRFKAKDGFRTAVANINITPQLKSLVSATVKSFYRFYGTP